MHTLSFFETYGIKQIGFWTTVIGQDNHALTYMLQWSSMAEREERWTAFQTDPKWVAVRSESEREQPIVVRIENSFMAPTEFSALR
jgi:hypothetical protein